MSQKRYPFHIFFNIPNNKESITFFYPFFVTFLIRTIKKYENKKLRYKESCNLY